MTRHVDMRPRRLSPGMTIGVVAPSGPVRDRAKLWQGIARLEQMGFRVVLGTHVFDSYGYLAGPDQARAADLASMLERDDVDAVMCVRGGYGAARTVRALDIERLRRLRSRPAKVFVGYSDITVLHAVLRRELGWRTFYGPMVSSFADPTDYTLSAFQQALLRAEPFEIARDPDEPFVTTLVAGQAAGRLAGGCLSLIVSLLGTPWELDLRDTILFFEDVHEAPYRIDRMLTQLLAAGQLDQSAGIVIGEHVGCAADDPTSSLSLEQVFDDLLRPLGIPCIYHLPIGHGRHLATLPLGAPAELDASRQRLRVLDPGVT